jgi:hypothetical protein
MTNRAFKREMNYQITMSFVRVLKNSGIISDDEYNKIDTIMLNKHRPVIGTLLSGNVPRSDV